MKFMLAPMEGFTDNSFRTLCYKYGADVTFTEMARFESLAKKNKSTLEKIEISNKTPTVIQLIGYKEIFLKKFLEEFKPEEGFLGFNFNLGCPAPMFVNYGMGCAMIKRISKIKKIVDIVKKRNYQCSIKLRLGMNRFEKEKKVYLNLINEVDADFFVVHARHGKETYDDVADWSVFEECCKTGKKIIANGDIKTREDVEALKGFGVGGVMIGREATKNPAVFNQLKGLKIPELSEIKREYLKIASKENDKYKKNVLKYLGNELIIKELKILNN